MLHELARATFSCSNIIKFQESLAKNKVKCTFARAASASARRRAPVVVRKMVLLLGGSDQDASSEEESVPASMKEKARKTAPEDSS